jgi:catechol 2,3-dioxygenase-like lactoylglutathione lyase family enzyme
MLATCPIVSFVPTRDAERARAFYEHTLGLAFVSDDRFAIVMQLSGNKLRLIRAGDFTPAPYTILGWEVTNIIETVTAFTEKGLVFERFPFIPSDQVDALGIWTAPNGNQVAWFKDPDGNTLSLSQH